MLISHQNNERFNLEEHIEYWSNGLDDESDLSEKIKLLAELSEFELGRFLLTQRGLNGYWTAYVILHGPHLIGLSSLESWILHRAPGIKGTHERFFIFQQQVMKRLSNNMELASIPCGLMDDLLTLDYSELNNITLTGIDLDPSSLELARKNAETKSIDFARFTQKDAWKLKLKDSFDLIVSNGLNIYEPDPQRLLELYTQFYSALKDEGILITSFVTPPPAMSSRSPWKRVNEEDALTQRLIFGELIKVNWQSYQLEEDVVHQLEQIGFSVQEVLYDSQGVFPTIVAKKDACKASLN
ncbi:MAG: methyltransferase domain-containing protein [Legionellaceae bacterium]|nr:methyltransferase domain-containing protein [Legionellaceae bacterium]